MTGQFFKNKTNFRGVLRSGLVFVVNKRRWIVSFAALALLAYCALLWYQYIYNARWSDSKKQEYIQAKAKEVVFDENKFDEVVNELARRKSESGKNLAGLQDIFRLKQTVTSENKNP